MKLPRFQRYEAWSHTQITALLNSVLQELPCGAVLTLEVSGKEPFFSREISGPSKGGERTNEHLLDGQQRLTALWRSLNDDYDNRAFFVQVGEDLETGEPFTAVSYPRYLKNGRQYPLWQQEPAELWKRTLIPSKLLLPGQESENAAREWAKLAANEDTEARIDIIEKINRLRQKFSAYNIPFLSLASTLNKDVILDVFVKMNTSASQLSDFDIVVAQVEAATEMGLHDLVEMLCEKVPLLPSYGNPADIILAVGALLQGRTPTKASYLSDDFAQKLIEDWEKVEIGCERAIRFMEDEKIIDAKRLPSEILLNTVGALWARVASGLDPEGRSRTIIRKYMWRAVFTERYNRTSATRALADVREIGNMLEGRHDATPPIFDEETYPLPDKEMIKGAAWPVRRDGLARGLLALSLRDGGLDLADGSAVHRQNIQDREYHHLFPKAWLAENGYLTSDADRAVNCAVISLKTNRNVSFKSPSEYIKERIDQSHLGEAEVKDRLQSHLIDFECLVSDDFDAFVDSRARLLHARMSSVCEGMA